ncbi:MAG TPA: DUF4317 domain-containing protein [Bacillota bacterium]|nr:DUF4317 domain-containing protein [Bacillota bacterium]
MNKKDIADIRKQLKIHNDQLTINDIFNVYITKESSEVYHHQSTTFEMMEDEQKELFMTNFKKVLTGQLDQKLFELKFRRDVEDSSQFILHHGLLSGDREEWTSHMIRLVEKMLKDKQYEMDIVITFIRGEYKKPMKRSNEASEESGQDTVYSHPFILCSVNQTEDPKKELLFDYIEKAFKYNIVVDPIINLKKPIAGFLFPTIQDKAPDVNHVLFSAGKEHDLNNHFIDEVLQAEDIVTAEEDKYVFEEVVKEVTGDHINTTTLSNVYDEVQHLVEAHEENGDDSPTLDKKDVENILTNSGVQNVDAERIEETLKRMTDNHNYELKTNNIVPKYTSKSIKIQTKVADIKVSPQDLKYVRQIHLNGKLSLVIELDENTVIDGFEMIPEALIDKKEAK